MGLVDESTFEGCRSLAVVDLPAKLSRIGRRAFKGCEALSSIILPSGVREIGLDAFAQCRSLARIAIPKDMRELEDTDVFGGCDSLTDISFGGSREAWELLTSGKTLTVERGDLSLFTPKVTFLNLKNEV